MPTSEVTCDAPPEIVWSLIARPGRWREWSPYVVGADGLGSPEVQEGAEGKVVLRGGVRLPARILSVERGREWLWQVGGIRILHGVEPHASGCVIRHEVTGSFPLWTAPAFAYLPAVALLARNIARVAERDSRIS